VILQNVEVVAAGQQLSAPDSAEANLSRSITLAVKAQDVSKLHLAATRGKIRLAIRNNSDAQAKLMKGTTQSKVLGEEQEDEEQVADNQKFSLLSFFNNKKDTEGFAATPMAAPITPPSNQPWAVVVVNGTNSQTVHFENRHSMRQVNAPASDDVFGFGAAQRSGLPRTGYTNRTTPANRSPINDEPPADEANEPMEETE
jgi:hypothetical protein